MEISIRINGRMVSIKVSNEVADYLNQAKHNNRSLCREERNHWDGRSFDEYIVSMEGRLPYQEMPEEAVCHRETLDEIMSVLELCTDIRSGFYFMRCTISAMRKLESCVDAPSMLSAIPLKRSGKFSRNFSKPPPR